jgi:peptide/nickel transport system substrate-binding protein
MRRERDRRVEPSQRSARRGPIKLAIAGVAVMALVASAAYASTGKSLAPAPNQSITVASYFDPEGNWEVWSKSTAAGRDTILWKNVYQRLYELNPDTSVTPQIAAGYPGYINRRTYVVKLRKGIRFSNGKELTSEDVVYSLNTIVAPATRTVITEALEIKEATAVDKYTVRITYRNPTALYLSALIRINIVPRGFTEWSRPIGSGAYVLESYTPGVRAVLTYNPRYSGPKPQVTRVTIKFIPDVGTRVQALQSGEVDLAYGLTADQAKVVPKVAYAPHGALEALIRLNTTKAPLNDVRVRQAMNYAVDKAKIAKVLFGPAAVPSKCQVMNPNTSGAHKSLKGYPYNPTKARQLLSAAGAVGVEVVIDSPSSYFPQDRNVVQAVAQYLNAVGFNARVNFVSVPTFGARVPTPNNVGPGADGLFLENGDTNANILPIWARMIYSKGFASAYANPAWDRLFEQALRDLNDRSRQKRADNLSKLVCDDAAVLFLYDRRAIVGMSKRITYTPSYGQEWFLDYDRVKVG